ncbi:MAG: ABC transporter substrate-binding protein [Rhizobiaceae bacterium]
MKHIGLGATVLAGAFTATMAFAETQTIAVANFGEHPQLNAVVQGIEDVVAASGRDIRVTVDHVNFDATLLPQMFTRIEASGPDIVVGITTPVAQNMLNLLGDSGIPLLFGAVTDPVRAELVPSWEQGGENITGASDFLDIAATLQFIHQLFPEASAIGIPYNPAEANDLATLALAQEAAAASGLTISEVGVDNPNDIMARVTALAARSDVIYGPGSSMIQPAIGAVASAAAQAGTPLVNMDDGPVRDGLAAAGFTVSYHRIGEIVGEMALRILDGESPASIAPARPSYDDHSMVISRSGMAAVGAEIPASFADCDCIVD